MSKAVELQLKTMRAIWLSLACEYSKASRMIGSVKDEAGYYRNRRALKDLSKAKTHQEWLLEQMRGLEERARQLKAIEVEVAD